jgi:CRP/FNR family transcriptional regulator
VAGNVLLRKSQLFSGLSDQELTTLSSLFQRRTFGRGVIIFHKESPPQNLYLIESGRVRIFVLSSAGQEISLNILSEGECFGELSLIDGLPRSAGAVTMEVTVVHSLDRIHFLQALENYPHFARNLIDLLGRRLRYNTALAESIAFLDIYGRVAAKLLELADRYGVVRPEGILIDLRLTQTELASWVMSSRESVNKVLGVFRERGFVQFEGQTLWIMDRAGLQKLANY